MSEPTTPVAPLEIRGLVRRYGGFTAVDNLDLVVSSGEIVGSDRLHLTGAAMPH